MFTCKLIIVITIAVMSTPVLSSDSYIDKYGITEGDEINTGFVFIEGKYKEPPYRISRQGLSLYVNEIKINSPTRHPGNTPFIIQGDPKSMSEDQRQRIVKILNITRDHYERYLSENDTYLFSDTGGHYRLSPYTTAYRLPEIIKIISSGLSIEEKELKLEPYNWHLYMNVRDFIINFSTPPELDMRLKHLAQELLHIDKFGVGEIMTVDKGFLFLHGEYIDTPFSIQRKGLGVFINDKLVHQPVGLLTNIPSGDVDPKLPAEIDSDSSINDDVVREYLGAKQEYLRKHRDLYNERDVMEQVIRSLPFIVSAELDADDSTIIRFTTNEGITRAQSLVSMPGIPLEYNTDAVVGGVDSEIRSLKRDFDDNDCVFITIGSKTIFPNQTLEDLLPQLVSVLQSSKSVSEKKQAIKDLNILIDSCISDLVENYKLNDKLPKRVQAINAKIN